MKKVIIRIVKGSDGYSLQIVDKDGNGYRFAGPKAWGNPLNKPTASFVVDLEEFIRELNIQAYDDELKDSDIK